MRFGHKQETPSIRQSGLLELGAFLVPDPFWGRSGDGFVRVARYPIGT
jgi:hypothetical protein